MLLGVAKGGECRVDAVQSHGPRDERTRIDLAIGDFGPSFPGGLFVAQDGMNAPAAQNFKLVPWAQIAAALGLEP